jgi:uncharacterized cofD-like protein
MKMNQEQNNLQPNIVVIGGGTGSFTILSGLKRYTSNITALVNMADDGGSTGILRDELGVLPPGDIRQCLVALSDTQKVRDLFTYRFDEGVLEGSSFGNLFISAVEKMTDSFEQAIEVASEVLRISGRVLPITLDPADLVAKTKSGLKIEGQSRIGNAKLDVLKPDLSYKQQVSLNPEARKAILEADVVVIAPGNLNGSLGPILVIDGVGDALKKTKAKVVCIANLVTKPGQTDDFSVAEHVDEIERFAGTKFVKYVVFNTDEPTKQMRDLYVRDGEYMLEFTLEDLEQAPYHAIGLPLIDKSPVPQQSNDKIAHVRSLIRHDSDRVAREVMKIYFS